MAAEHTPSPSTELLALLETPIRDPISENTVKEVLANPPFLQVPMGLNLRTISSPTLAPNIVFRSGNLAHLSHASLDLLKSEYNITTIFDLRSRGEREKTPTPQIEGIETVWVPSTLDIENDVLNAAATGGKAKPIFHSVNPGDFVANGGVDGYVNMYGNVLNTHRNAYKAFFERLRDGEGGVLFHCAAGKDRTGVLAALVHALLESPEDIIAQDYALTRVGVEVFRERLLQSLLAQMGHAGEMEFLEEPGMEELCGVKGPHILAFLDSLDEKYGGTGEGKYAGARGYLVQELGMTSEDLEKIKKRLSAVI